MAADLSRCASLALDPRVPPRAERRCQPAPCGSAQAGKNRTARPGIPSPDQSSRRAQPADPGAGVEREREMSARISRAWHVLSISGCSYTHDFLNDLLNDLINDLSDRFAHAFADDSAYDFKRRLCKPAPPGKISSAARAIERHGESAKHPIQRGSAIG